MLGPQLKPVGSGDALLSEQVKAATEHKYAPERYMYREVSGECGRVGGASVEVWQGEGCQFRDEVGVEGQL